MPPSPSTAPALESAAEFEKRYEWDRAAVAYEKALAQVPGADRLQRGGLKERIGYSTYRLAMQAADPAGFRATASKAAKAYREALSLYGEPRCQGAKARALRCEAMVSCIGYWLAAEAPEKKKLICDSWRLAKGSLDAFEEAGEAQEYGLTFNQLSSIAHYCSVLQWDFWVMKSVLNEGAECGEKAKAMGTRMEDPGELARIYAKTAYFVYGCGYYFLDDMDEKWEHLERSRKDFAKALELSEENAFLELMTISETADMFTSREANQLEFLNKALLYAEKTKDNFLIGTALDIITFYYAWTAYSIEDAQERLGTVEKILRRAREARERFSLIGYTSARAGTVWIESPHTELYESMSHFETDRARSLDLLQKSVETGLEGVRKAECTGYPLVVILSHHAVSKSLASLAALERYPGRRRDLLGQALEHRNEAIALMDRLFPYDYWSRGVMYNYLADIELELSKMVHDAKEEKAKLEEAIFHKDCSLQICVKQALFEERAGDLILFPVLGRIQKSQGEALSRLYGITNDAKHQREAIRLFREAAATFLKKGLNTRAAECHWKAGEGQSNLGDNLKASASFALASEAYREAAKRMPQFKGFFDDYRLYMDAWSQIERAKHFHARREYSQGKECYERAAGLHESSKRWAYLASNYAAWVQLEGAEDLSRREEGENAIQAFEGASSLFDLSKKRLEGAIARIEDPDEKQLAKDLIKAADIRRGYCSARIMLEEAANLDRKGEHFSSSERYGTAADALEKGAAASKSREIKNELERFATIARAWEKMTLAKAERSPSLCAEASSLFEKVKGYETDERAKSLSMGHSHFCRALEEGMGFIETLDESSHQRAMQQLESALGHYAEGGFRSVSQYAKATGLLFDAYFYSAGAKKEKAPEAKAKQYMAAESLLDKSMAYFRRIGHHEKAEQVSRLLEDVKEERETAVSLAKVLCTPLLESASTFPAPSPTFEKAVGSEAFRHADIQAQLALPNEVSMGDEFDIRLDLFNAAENFGLLIRVENLIPPKIKITGSDGRLEVEGGSLDMKGKRLSPLQLESISLRGVATEPGEITFSPKVVFVDEVGKFRAQRLEQVVLSARPKLQFEFDTDAAQNAFSFLADAFLDDYMRKKLPLEKSGWRTLMDVSKGGGVSRSSVYDTRGGKGGAISELEGRGLIDVRVFPGERGRGGRIMKARLEYEKEIVKRYADLRVMKKDVK